MPGTDWATVAVAVGVLVGLFTVAGVALWRLAKRDEVIERRDLAASVQAPSPVFAPLENRTVDLSVFARRQVAELPNHLVDPDTAIMVLPSDRQVTAVIRRPPRGVVSQLRLPSAPTAELPVVRDGR